MDIAAHTADAQSLTSGGDDITPDNFGGKGFSLHRLAAAGLHVPPFIVITADEFSAHLARNDLIAAWETHFRKAEHLDDNHWRRMFAGTTLSATLHTRIASFVAAHPAHTFAVRSSGSLEDGRELSFAGQYETFLNLRQSDDILTAVQHCWASLFAERVVAYLAQQNTAAVQPPRMAVVVQVMVPAEQSGVGFSIDPTTGRDTHVVIEAVRGLGEGLVSGRIAPDRYIVDWYREQTIATALAHCDRAVQPLARPPFVEERALPAELAQQAVLTPARIAEIAALCARVQALYGFPVDIEWALHKGKLWLLQARPITTLQMTCTDQQWTTADFRDGGVSSDVCTPFMWSLYDYIWERAMPAYMRAVNMLPPTLPELWGTMFFARPYWNVGAIKQALALLPGYVEAEFDDDLGIEKNYAGRGHVTRTSIGTALRGMRVLLALKRSFKKQLALCKTFQPAQRQHLAALDDTQPEDFSDAEFIAFYRTLVTTDYYRSEGTYFTLIYNNSNYTALFREKLTKLVPDSDYPQLISGLENVSHLRQTQDLWQLVQTLSRQGHGAHWLRASDAELLRSYRGDGNCPGMDAVRAHIRKFRHHSMRELDIRVPRIDEDPTSIFTSIRQLLNSTDLPSPAAVAEQQKQRFETERERILRQTSKLSRRGLRKALDMMRDLLWWREELRDMSTHYYYHIRRFTWFLGTRWSRAGKIDGADDIFFLTMQEIVAELEQPGSVALRRIIDRNRTYYRGFRHFRNPNEVAPQQSMAPPRAADASGELRGIGCSRGYIEGIARVITSLPDAERLQQGDILVTHFTDPGWTLKFPLLSGVITESGGMLSHAAVIAREYGIPAVLAVNGATRHIRDGQRIGLDGHSGRIDLLEPA